MYLKKTKVLVLLVLGVSCDVSGVERNSVPEIPETGEIREILRASTEYEIDRQPPINEQGSSWRLCTFYVGALSAYRATRRDHYRELASQWAEANDWRFRSDRRRHADFQCIGQVFLGLYFEERDDRKRRATQATMDEIIDDPRLGEEMWSWADALFMAPPVWARLGTVTGKDVYFDFMSDRFWQASEPLFDPGHGLYYRDERFVDRESAHGAPVFWSRGNGWVLAGIVRILQHLPENHSAHSRFVKRFRTMAAAVAPLQQDDGLWRTSLLDPREYPAPETSGTALFTYALAWGINEGYLSRKNYRGIVLRGWRGLSEAVSEEGRLGWVQEVGSRPGPVKEEGTGAYAVGGLLMAGSEILRMIE